MRRTLIAIAIAAAVAVPSIGQAKTFRWAAQGDILTFDPHSQNEGMTIAANSYVYEPLVDYDKSFKVVPRLATGGEQVAHAVPLQAAPRRQVPRRRGLHRRRRGVLDPPRHGADLELQGLHDRHQGKRARSTT